jgi:hypothetical protein
MAVKYHRFYHLQSGTHRSIKPHLSRPWIFILPSKVYSTHILWLEIRNFPDIIKRLRAQRKIKCSIKYTYSLVRNRQFPMHISKKD